MNLGCGAFDLFDSNSLRTLKENVKDLLEEAEGEMYDGISPKANALDIFERKLNYLLQEAYFKPDPQHDTEQDLILLMILPASL